MADNGDIEISLDKLPIKRVEFIEDSGIERFPPEIGYEEKTVNLIRRIDFAWAVERDTKKQKKAKESFAPSTWQGLVENLQLAHQELSIIIDLINTVEANDAVAVAGMTRPKPLPNEVLSDLAVSTATKLQSFRHLSKYFKQSANSLEQQIAREARFYGALIRLQQNWKIKRHRVAANAAGSELFLIDLTDSSVHERTALNRLPPFSIVGVDHDSSGMLAVNMPKHSCNALHFGFLDVDSNENLENRGKMNFHATGEYRKGTKKDSLGDDARIRDSHRVLRDAHKAIFHEQLFELLSCESFNPTLGVNVTGLREKYLELSINAGVSVYIALDPSKQDDQIDKNKSTQTEQDISSHRASKQDTILNFRRPNHVVYEAYLEQLFHEEIFRKVEDRPTLPSRIQPNQHGKDAVSLVSHFCLSLAHQIFSNNVLKELENLATRIPYLQLSSQPTWYSRTSSWILSVNVPDSVLNRRIRASRSDDDDNDDDDNEEDVETNISNRCLFRTKVLVKDDCISVEGGGAPNAAGLFKSNPQAVGFKNRFRCDLVDLPMVLLLQVANKIIDWLNEEALMLGIKTRRDFLSLSLDIDQGETLSLTGHVDPDDTLGCISWWLIMEDEFAKEPKLEANHSYEEISTRRFLGYLSLDELYSTLMDLISLSSATSNH